jgi:hypothetical protein
MALDFSWPKSAKKYFELYKKLMGQTPSPVRNLNNLALREG